MALYPASKTSSLLLKLFRQRGGQHYTLDVNPMPVSRRINFPPPGFFRSELPLDQQDVPQKGRGLRDLTFVGHAGELA